MGRVFPSPLLAALGAPHAAVRRLCSSLCSTSSSRQQQQAGLLCSNTGGPLKLTAPRLRHVPGASRMRWPYQPPAAAAAAAAAATRAEDWREWVRKPLRCPETGEPINWLYGEPESGYEALSIYGQDTIQVDGLPMGRTPEFLQERLWRYFSKFGQVKNVHVLQHPRDPYQTNGKAFVAFEDREAALRAVRLPVRLPASLHYKVLKLRHIATGRCSDDLYIHRKLHANKNILFLARQMYEALLLHGPLSLSSLRRLSLVRGFCGERTTPHPSQIFYGDCTTPHTRSYGHSSTPHKSLYGDSTTPHPSKRLYGERTVLHTRGAWREAAGCVNLVFGSWKAFLETEPFNELFKILPAPGSDRSEGPAACASAAAARRQQQLLLAPRLVSPEKVEVLLKRGSRLLHKKLEAELSVHWRQGKPQLPDETKRQIDRWLHKEPLPEELQTWSRSKDAYKIYDERHQFKLRLRKARKNAELQRRLQRAAVLKVQQQRQQQLV